MATDEELNVRVKVDTKDLDRAALKAKQLEATLKKMQTTRIRIDSSGLSRAESKMRSLRNMTTATKNELGSALGKIQTAPWAPASPNILDFGKNFQVKNIPTASDIRRAINGPSIQLDPGNASAFKAAIENAAGATEHLGAAAKSTSAAVSALRPPTVSWRNWGMELDAVATKMRSLSSTFKSIGYDIQHAATILGAGLGAGAAIGGGGLAALVNKGIKTAKDIEASTQQLIAQGVDSQRIPDLKKDIRSFAEKTPFGISDLTESISSVNSYVGNIDEAIRATKEFGISLFASGRDASQLLHVAPNLGQLWSGAFTKIDYKELLRGVPAMAAALRDVGIKSWEEFNQALGDDPNTKAIERTGNALDLITDAITKYNVKTNALEESNKSLKAVWGNTTEQINNQLADMAESSGLFDSVKTSLDILGKGAVKNMPAIEKLYRVVGEGMVKTATALANFDWGTFFTKSVEGLKSVASDVDKFLTPVKPLLHSLGHWMTGGEKGAIGLANAFTNLSRLSIKGFIVGFGLNTIGKMLNVLQGSVGGIASLLKTIGRFKAGTGPFNKLFNMFSGVDKLEKDSKRLSTVAKSVPSSLKGLSTGLAASGSKLSKIGRGFGGLFKGFNSLTGVGIAASVGSILLVANQLKNLPNAKELAEGTAKLVAVTAAFSGINVALSRLNNVGGNKAIATGAKLNIMNAASIAAIAIAIRQLNDLPDAGTIFFGVAKVAAVAAGMTALNTGLSKLTKLVGGTARGTAVQAMLGIIDAAEIVALSTAIRTLNRLPDAGTVASGIGKLILVAGAMTGLNAAAGALTKIPKIGAMGMAMGALIQFVNALEITALTSAIKKMSELPSFGAVMGGFGKLAAVSAGMTVLNAAYGVGAMASFGTGALVYAIGSLINFVNTANINTLSNAIRNMSNLPSIGDVRAGFNKLSEISKAMTGLNVGIGAKSLGTLGFHTLLNHIGAFTNMINSVSVVALSTAVRSLTNLPSQADVTSGAKKLTELSKVMPKIQSSLISLDPLLTLGEKWSAGNMTGIINSIVESTSGLTKLRSIKIPAVSDIPDFGPVFISIERIFNQFTIIGTWSGKLAAGNIKDTVHTLVEMIEPLRELDRLDNPPKLDNMSKFGEAISKLNDAMGGSGPFKSFYRMLGTLTDKASAGNIRDQVKIYLDLMRSVGELASIAPPENTANLTKNVEQLKDFIQAMDTLLPKSSTGAGENKSGMVQQLSDIKQMAADMQAISESLTNLSNVAEVSKTNIEATRDRVQDVINGIKYIARTKVEGKGGADDAGKFAGLRDMTNDISKLIENFASISAQLKQVQLAGLETKALAEQIKFTVEGVKTAVNLLNEAIISTFAESKGDAGATIGDKVVSKLPVMESIQKFIESLAGLSQALTTVQQAQVNVDQLTEAVIKIKTSIGVLNHEVNAEFMGTSENLANNAGTGGDEATGMMASLKKITDFANSLSALQGALVQVQEAKVNADLLRDAMTSLKESLTQIVSSLTTDAAFGDVVGGLEGDGGVGAIVGKISAFVESIRSAINQINELSGSANTAGHNLGQAVIDGFNSNDFAQMKAKVEDSLKGMDVIGTNAGNALKTGFNSGIAGMADHAVAEVERVKGALNSIPKSISIHVDVTDNISSFISRLEEAKKKKAGGYISGYASGGAVGSKPFGFNRNSTDKIPALLTVGEFVQNRNAVNFWGRGFMEAINSRNADRAEQLMRSRMASMTSPIVNNSYVTDRRVSTTNSPTINQTFYGGSSQEYGKLAKATRGL